MNKIKLAALQLQLNKTDNLDFLLNQLDDLIKRRDDLDLIILSELAVGGAGAKNCNHPLSKYEKIFSDFAKSNSIFLIPEPSMKKMAIRYLMYHQFLTEMVK